MAGLASRTARKKKKKKKRWLEQHRCRSAQVDGRIASTLIWRCSSIASG
jgi:hypothetical protein